MGAKEHMAWGQCYASTILIHEQNYLVSRVCPHSTGWIISTKMTNYTLNSDADMHGAYIKNGHSNRRVAK